MNKLTFVPTEDSFDQVFPDLVSDIKFQSMTPRPNIGFPYKVSIDNKK